MSYDLAKQIAEQLESRKEKNGGTILLEGPWGVGKTHFWKNDVTKILKEKSATSITISLFGAKNKSDVSTRLFSEFLDCQTEAVSETARNLIKKARSIGATGLLSSILENKIGIPITYESTNLIPNSVILCFDDLERISEDADLVEILGFINGLAETRKFSCLIVYNESEISDPHKQTFLRIKEKVCTAAFKAPQNTRERVGEFVSVLSSLKNYRESEGRQIVEFAEMVDTKNLRTMKNIVNAFEILKRATNLPIKPGITNFLMTLIHHRSLGKAKDRQFYNVALSNIYSRSRNMEDGPDKADFESLVSTYLSKFESYEYSDSVFDLVDSGFINLDFKSEIVADIMEPKLDTTKFAEELRDLRIFYKTEAELKELKNKVEQLVNNSSEFEFGFLLSILETYCSMCSLIGIAPEIVPAKLAENARTAIRKSTRQIVFHDGMFREMDVKIREILRQVSDSENFDKCIKEFLDKFNNGRLSDIDEEFFSNEEVLSSFHYKGYFQKVFGVRDSERIQSHMFLEKICKAMWSRNSNEKIKTELENVSKFLNDKYAASKDSMDRLRLYRIIEATNVNVPSDIPVGLRT